jgi:hypothetical protein
VEEFLHLLVDDLCLRVILGNTAGNEEALYYLLKAMSLSTTADVADFSLWPLRVEAINHLVMHFISLQFGRVGSILS